MSTGIEYLSSQEGCSVGGYALTICSSVLLVKESALGDRRTEGILLCEIQLLLVLSSTPPPPLIINPTKKKRYPCLNNPSFFQILGLTFPFWDDYDNDDVHSKRKKQSFHFWQKKHHVLSTLSQLFIGMAEGRGIQKQPTTTSHISDTSMTSPPPNFFQVGVILLEVNLQGGYRKTAATHQIQFFTNRKKSMEMSQKVMIVTDPIGSNGKTCIVEIKPGRYSIYIYVYIYIYWAVIKQQQDTPQRFWFNKKKGTKQKRLG